MINNGFHILSGLDLLQVPLQFFIVNTVETLSPEYLLNVFLPPLSRISDHLTELPVSLALLHLFRQIEGSGSVYLDIKGLSLLLPFDDPRVTRKSIFNMFRDVLWRARIACNAHVDKATWEPIDK